MDSSSRARRLLGVLIAAFMLATAMQIGVSSMAASAARSGTASIAGDDEESNNRWVASWASAHHTTGAELRNQTIRMVVHLSQGGDRVRVRLANTLGAEAMRVGAATVGVRNDGAGMVGESLTPLTFDRGRTVSILPGGYVVSDPVKLTTLPGQDLAVSVYLPDAVTPSAHASAFDTSYLTDPLAGDHSGDIGGSAYTHETGSYLVVNAVDVYGEAVGTVVVAGGSVTDGQGSRASGLLGTGRQAAPNSRWSDVLARRFIVEKPVGAQLAVVNAGVSGNTASRECGALAGIPAGEYANVEDRYGRDVLGQSGVTHIVLYAGTNDLGIGTGCSSEKIVAAFTRLVDRAHARGVQVVVATVTPRGSYTGLQNQERFKLNSWILRGGDCSGICDGVVDFDSTVAWFAYPNAIDPTFDSGDGIHPNSDGYRVMAEAFDLGLF